jgi:ABC-type nitrate/sulfonate/bicarbonate transport system substrate-binding protein
MTSLTLKRRYFLAAGSAVAAAAITSGWAVAQDKMPLRLALDWVPSGQYAGFFSALERGQFAERGLDVSFTAGGPNAPSPFVLVSAGTAEIAAGTWLSTLDAIAKDNDFVIIGASFPQSPGGILSLPSKPIHTAADLNGKRLMIQDPSLSVIFDGMLAFAGLKPDYEVVMTGFSIDPLLAGDGDGYLCFINNQPLALEAMGMVKDKDFVLATFHDLGYDIPEALMVVKRAFILEHRAALVDYLEVLLRGWNAHDANPAAALRYIVDTYGQEYGFDYDLSLREDALQSPLTFAPNGGARFDIATDQISKMYELAELTGRKPPASDSIIDLSLLHDAAARL